MKYMEMKGGYWNIFCKYRIKDLDKLFSRQMHKSKSIMMLIYKCLYRRNSWAFDLYLL